MPDTRSSEQQPQTVSTAIGGWLTRLAFLAILACGVLTAFYLVSSPQVDGRSRHVAAPAKANLARLVASTTDTTVHRAPLDHEQEQVTAGDVVHPTRTVAVYTAPTGRPFAKVTPTQLGDTWLPVVARRPGWVKVLLPSRPNGSTGWMPTATVQQARTPYLIRVHLGSRQLVLYKNGRQVASWSVAVGAPETPTPTGRTFLLGSVVDDQASYSPVILPLGAHSNTLDSYGGGPGTVALHGWPDTSVFGHAVSHGCIRVPADALHQLTDVPLGTLVLIDHH